MKCADCPIRRTCPERDRLITVIGIGMTGHMSCCFGHAPKPHEVCSKAYCKVTRQCHAYSEADPGTVAVYEETDWENPCCPERDVVPVKGRRNSRTYNWGR